MHNTLIRSLLTVGIAALSASCGNGGRGDRLQPGELARVGQWTLTAAEVSEAMPYGLTGEDSATWCRSYIDNWIERKSVGIEAARNIADTEVIDRLAEEYRNDLLMLEYRKAMAGQQDAVKYSDDTLRAEYERTPGLYRTVQPMMRGIFLSVEKKHPRLGDLRRWSRSSSPGDMEKLEKESLDPDVEYIYFRDRWMPWSDIVARVPGGVDADPRKLFALHPGFETTVGDRVYMLVVSDYLAPGEQMPFELARESVIAMLQSTAAADYDRRLRRALVERAIENGLVILSPEIADTARTAAAVTPPGAETK